MPRGRPNGGLHLATGLHARRLGEHLPDCRVVQRASETGTLPGHQWFFAPEGYRGEPAVEKRDLLGRLRKNGGRRWLRYICNHLNCPARLVVREDSLLLAAGVPLQ